MLRHCGTLGAVGEVVQGVVALVVHVGLHEAHPGVGGEGLPQGADEHQWHPLWRKKDSACGGPAEFDQPGPRSPWSDWAGNTLPPI